MSTKLFKSWLFKAAQIDQMIEREHKRKLPDTFKLLHLKKLRLRLKDRLQRLTHHLVESHRPLQPVRIHR